MSFGFLGADNSTLQRLDTLAGDAPGKIRYVPNKSADQGGHTNTENIDGTGHWEIRVYNGTGAAMVAGNWYHLTFDGDEETNPKVIAFTTAANTNYRLGVVAMEASADATWCWCAFSGVVDVVAVDATTDIAKDDFLKLDVDTATTGLTCALKDGTAETNNSVAIATVAVTTDGRSTTRCILLGKRAVFTT